MLAKIIHRFTVTLLCVAITQICILETKIFLIHHPSVSGNLWFQTCLKEFQGMYKKIKIVRHPYIKHYITWIY